MRRLLFCFLLAGCAPTAPERAARWPTFALVQAARDGIEAGGFPPGTFVTLKGGKLPFRDEPALADGWSVLPAFAQGQPAAYVVSEVWEAHPDPWTQPVYALVDAEVKRQTVGGVLVPTVFGVGEQSTFYSPFWDAFLVQTRTPAPAEGLPDVRAVLDAATEVRFAARPLCPIVPDGFTFAAATAQGPVRPLTLTPVKGRSLARVRIDGATASYFDYGPDRFEARDSGIVIATRIFFFTRANGELLELPAVLAGNAVRRGYARRFNVVLDQEQVFVPAGAQWDAVRQKLGARLVDPLIPAATAAAYALRVARTFGCFEDAASFPAGCQWLDSEAAIDRLEPRRIVRTEATLTAVPMLFNGEAL